MPVNASRNGNKIEIRVNGRFDFSVHREFRDAYRDTEGPACEYEVNLRGVEYMDSSALGMLLLLREYAGGERARIAISNCGSEICRILQIANFQQLFRMS